MKMRYTPFFSAFSGFPGRQPRAPAHFSGPAHSGRTVGPGLMQGLRLTNSFLPGSLLLPSRCTGLTASRSQGGSLALGFWAQAVVGRPGQQEARGQVFPAAPTPASFGLSPCPPPDGDTGSLPEIKGCHPVPCGEEERGETLSFLPSPSFKPAVRSACLSTVPLGVGTGTLVRGTPCRVGPSKNQQCWFVNPLSSPTRDRTHAPGNGSASLNHQTPRELPPPLS
ncbi:uncharacterized protein LOC123331602 [Bubalus bubalis]|uniref:uncharacterized protein LOC123331602 n=1 Tax=Bubalus bubalis TaxID=89462 RepID=UPI001E1B71CE|nr:uncharacterized protein LOC123331602 [Bubalus bubalis]